MTKKKKRRDTTKATKRAVEVNKEKGAKTADTLYKLIDREPQHSVYWYAKKLNWSYGKTQKAVERLEKAELVKHKYYHGFRRLKKRIVPLEPHELKIEL